MKKEIYLDNAATTKVNEKVLEEMKKYFSEKYANASSKHEAGRNVRYEVEKARKVIAKSINAKKDEIIFTSGGTESNNFALKGLFEYHKENKGKNKIITTKIEHDSILEVCKYLEKKGAEVIYLDVDSKGFIDLGQLKKEVNENTIVVSIIHGNNEIGTIQDLNEISKICSEKDVILHIDSCQSYTKIPIDVTKQNISLMTINAHKIHGPKGVGALYIDKSLKDKIVPLLHGGGHENELRSGTENVPGIIGFTEAVKNSNKKDVEKMKKLRNNLIKGLLEIDKAELNGPEGDNRLCNNINVSFGNIEGEAIGGYLEANKIYTSTGSACSSHTLKTSHVLKAIGLDDLKANSSIRISISKYTTEEDIDYFLEKIKRSVKKLRGFSPF
jgi:cysteine desulfurase